MAGLQPIRRPRSQRAASDRGAARGAHAQPCRVDRRALAGSGLSAGLSLGRRGALLGGLCGRSARAARTADAVATAEAPSCANVRPMSRTASAVRRMRLIPRSLLRRAGIAAGLQPRPRLAACSRARSEHPRMPPARQRRSRRRHRRKHRPIPTPIWYRPWARPVRPPDQREIPYRQAPVARRAAADRGGHRSATGRADRPPARRFPARYWLEPAGRPRLRCE